METINKISEKEVEIVKTIPEQVIPAKEERVTYSVEGLQGQIDSLIGERTRHEGYLVDAQKEVDKITNDIANVNARIAELEATITKISPVLAVEDKIVE